MPTFEIILGCEYKINLFYKIMEVSYALLSELSSCTVLGSN